MEKTDIMRKAIALSIENVKNGGGPFGAVIVKDGKIAYPVKGATLIGNGANVLLKIDMVANNLKRAQGICGASSGSIPADVGQPTIRVSSMTVGGRGGN